MTEKYTWSGWEAEPDVTGDGEGDPEKFFAFVWEDGEEYATVVHRTVGGKYPIDGDLAEAKQARAQRIAFALNALTEEES